MGDGLGTSLRWVRVAGGRFLMGSFDFYPEEAPQRERTVEAFEMLATPVTGAQFAAFVDATGYVTVAERELGPAGYPHLTAPERAAGSMVFTPTSGPVDLRDWRLWWSWVPGAQWRHPLGPDSDLTGLADHPVAQVAHADAVAFATWAGARLPTEVELEYAAGGGLVPAPYSWGRERDPGGVAMANTWHGRFPYLNTGSNGWTGTSPVGAFPPNGFGLYDCIGNVWEWTLDRHDEPAAAPRHDRVTVRPHGPAGEASAPRRVLKGGSHLCAPEYSLRYRPAARLPRAEDSATNDVGFRCVRP